MRLNILTIYLKEMKEVLRDRKTLIFMVVLPTLVSACTVERYDRIPCQG